MKVFWVFLLAILVLVQAQTLRSREFGLGVGLAQGVLRNDAVSALRRTGYGLPIQFHFIRTGLRSWQQIQVSSTNYVALSSAYGNRTKVTTGQMSYTYLRRCATWRDWTAWAGGTLSMQGYYLAYLDGFGNTDNPSASGTLSASVMGSRPVARGRLEVQAGAGLADYALLPNYSLAYPGVNSFGEWVQSGGFRALPRLGVFNARVAYETPVSTHFSMRFTYNWQLLRAQQPRPVGLLTNQLTASLCYGF